MCCGGSGGNGGGSNGGGETVSQLEAKADSLYQKTEALAERVSALFKQPKSEERNAQIRKLNDEKNKIKEEMYATSNRADLLKNGRKSAYGETEARPFREMKSSQRYITGKASKSEKERFYSDETSKSG